MYYHKFPLPHSDTITISTSKHHTGLILVDTTLANYKICGVGSTIHIFICIYHIHILLFFFPRHIPHHLLFITLTPHRAYNTHIVLQIMLIHHLYYFILICVATYSQRSDTSSHDRAPIRRHRV